MTYLYGPKPVLIQRNLIGFQAMIENVKQQNTKLTWTKASKSRMAQNLTDIVQLFELY